MRKAGAVLVSAALLGVAGGYVWAKIPPSLTMSSEEIERIEGSVTYSGCNEVRALGRDPIYRGQPGYSINMDGDGDGIACEPHHAW